MKNILIILSLLLCSLDASAQYKYDYNWLFGEAKHPLFPTSGIRFHFGDGTRESYKFNSPYGLYVGAACISDPDTGELLFYTNGCDIRSKDHEIIENGDDLIPSSVHDRCETVLTPSAYKNLLILPDLYNNNGYYLFYRYQYDQPPIFRDLNYAYIDMNLNDGAGRVTMKNIKIFDDLSSEARVLTASMHENGKDWHIVNMSNDNEIFLSAVDENGPRFVGIQSIETNTFGTGHCVFSPDGSQYICFSTYGGLSMYDFDNRNGTFSRFRFYEPIQGDQQGINGFVSISPSGEYGYFGSAKELYQVNMKTDELFKIANSDSTLGEEQDRKFAYALRGPDCKIYISAPYMSDVFHVIHKPDMPKADCDFRQQDLRVSIKRESGIMPYYPNYNFNEDAVCDRTITNTFSVDNDKGIIKVSPNPTLGELKLAISELAFPVKGNLFHINGTLIMSLNIDEREMTIDLSDFSNGVYFLNLVDQDGNMTSRKVVKIE